MNLAEAKSYVQNLGTIGFARYAVRRAVNQSRLARAPYKLNSRYTRFPLWCRPGTSDLSMFAEIISHRAFRCLDGIADAHWIIDCGANVGYSSAYFLTRYPQATLVSIEPDPENFRMLEQNLSPYAGRYHAIQSALWSHQTGLVMSEDGLGAGNECGRTVRPICAEERPVMTGLDIDSILDRFDIDRISILKVDVEGAEKVIFASNYERWLPRVDGLVIELHDPECERIFKSAIAHENFEISTCDDQVVCLRPRGRRRPI
ncbi:MAG: FkbM family methyltransferase [Steroidobacteraceae bacterium]